jgi:hypothetical protein
MSVVRKEYDVTNIIVCDFCSADHSDTSTQGGLLFMSKGICPACVPKLEEDVKKYGEEHFIRARALPGETFKDFIIRIRDGNNTMIVSGDAQLHEIAEELIARRGQ